LKRKPVEGDSGEELGDDLLKSGKDRSMVMEKFLLGLAKAARKRIEIIQAAKRKKWEPRRKT